MSGADYAAVLPLLGPLKSWISQIEDAALQRLLAGEEINGYKVVEGRSNRAFTDQDAAFDAIIAAGYDRDLLYERRPLTLSATEKLMGKAKFEEVAGQYVVKPHGAPTVVPITDKRPPYTDHLTPEEAFQN